MIIAPVAYPVYVSSVEDIRTTAFRRVAPSQLERLLTETTLTDSLTVRIRYWYTQYREAICGGAEGVAVNIQAINTRFIPLLKELLTDPITHIPLINAMIGTDGITYSNATLHMHSLGVPEIYRTRSPLYPRDEAIFTASPHPIARYLIEWLIARDPEFLHEAHNMEIAAATVYSQEARTRRILERHTRVQREQAEELAARNEAELEGERAALRAHLAPADELAENTHQVVMGVIAQAQQDGTREREVLRLRLDQVERELVEIQAQIEPLRARQARLDDGITAVEREDQRLDLLFAETAVAIKKSKRNVLVDVIVAVAIVGACVYGAYLLQTAAAAAGSSGTAYTFGGLGGGGIGLALKF